MRKSVSDIFISPNSQNLALQPKSTPIESTKNESLTRLLKHAHILQTKGLFDSAILVYEKIILAYPQNFSSKVNLAYCLLKLDMYERALVILSQASSTSPHNFYITYNQSLACFMLGNNKQALQILEQEETLRSNLEVQELKEVIVKHMKKPQRPRIKRHKSIKIVIPSKEKPKILEQVKKFSDSVPKIIIQNSSLPGSSEYSMDSSSKLTKSVTIDEIIEKKEFLSRMLHEREARLSIIANSPFFHKQSPLAEGFFQENLEQQPVPALLTPRKQINIETEAPFEPLNFTPDGSFDTVSEKKLSQSSIKFILSEYNKPKAERDYPALLKKFSKLPFFIKFPKNIQLMLLETAELIIYKTDEVIIKQGEIGECMFVILSGSVTIVRKAAEYRNFNIIVNSIYDGEAFGELALLSHPKESDIRRTASCVAGETTIVISISKADYRHILLEKMHSDIIERIGFIQNLKLFTSQPWISLIPFASSLNPHTFKVGEVILEQGEVPRGMHIVYSGRCKVYWEGYVDNAVKTERHFMKKPFSTGNCTQAQNTPRNLTVRLSEEVDKQFIRKIREKLRKEEEEKAKVYLKKPFLLKNFEKRRIDYSILKEKDFFAGRAILGKRRIEPSKFTVVSESKEVKLFIIEKRNLSYLGEDFYDELKKEIEKADDIDCPRSLNAEDLHSKFCNWHEFKSKFMQTLLKISTEDAEKR